MAVLKYSVVVPAYKEASIIGGSLKTLAASLKENGLFDQTEVIVVTADSDDGTAEVAAKQSGGFSYFQLIKPGPKVGKGRDVRAGVLAAKGDYIIFTDADMATPPQHIKHGFELLQEGADVVIGVRPLSRVHNSFMRRARSVVSNLLIRSMAVPGVPDTQCGFKGFTREAARQLFEPLETMAWGFDIEILVRAKTLKHKIKQIVITDWYDPKIGQMGLAGESDFHANMNTLKELFQIAYKRLTGYYKQ